jgi:hypothetical protein
LVTRIPRCSSNQANGRSGLVSTSKCSRASEIRLAFQLIKFQRQTVSSLVIWRKTGRMPTISCGQRRQSSGFRPRFLSRENGETHAAIGSPVRYRLLVTSA